MAKYLFTVIPALGHINPMMPVAAELKKRGHTVGFVTGKDYIKGIESEGMHAFPLGFPGLESGKSHTLDKMFLHTGVLSNYYFFKYLADVNLGSIDGLRSLITSFKPDVIVNDSLTYSGSQAAELYSLPWATFCSVPGLIPSSDTPPFTTWGLPPTKNTLIKTVYSIIRFGQNLFFRLFDSLYNRNRKALGLPPVKTSVIYSSLSPNLIMVPTCEGFEYKRSDWPPQLHLLGPAPWGKNNSKRSSDAWIDELPQDKPVIYVTIGTVQGLRLLEFFDKIIDALKDEPYYVVMSVGQTADLSRFSSAPGHFRFERFVPHSRILPRITAVIHHGGQGISQDSICHGLPSVVIPISQDLYEVARRCTSAGVSVRIPYPKLTPECLRSALTQILTEPEIKDNTKKLQSVFLKTNAGVTGAELLEKLFETKSPVYRKSV